MPKYQLTVVDTFTFDRISEEDAESLADLLRKCHGLAQRVVKVEKLAEETPRG